jgi:hypothetical protein
VRGSPCPRSNVRERLPLFESPPLSSPCGAAATRYLIVGRRRTLLARALCVRDSRTSDAGRACRTRMLGRLRATQSAHAARRGVRAADAQCTGLGSDGAQKKRRTHVKDEQLPHQSKAHNPKSFVLRRGRLAVRTWLVSQRQLGPRSAMCSQSLPNSIRRARLPPLLGGLQAGRMGVLCWTRDEPRPDAFVGSGQVNSVEGERETIYRQYCGE